MNRQGAKPTFQKGKRRTQSSSIRKSVRRNCASRKSGNTSTRQAQWFSPRTEGSSAMTQIACHTDKGPRENMEDAAAAVAARSPPDKQPVVGHTEEPQWAVRMKNILS